MEEFTVFDNDPIIYQDSNADDTESKYVYESGSEYASDRRSLLIPETELEDTSGSDPEYTSDNDSERAPEVDSVIAPDTEMEEASDFEESGAGSEDTDMESEDDEGEDVNPRILPNVEAGWPTNLTCRDYE
jgi:hypothetical protein